MAKSPTEQIREVERTLEAVNERVNHLRTDANDGWDAIRTLERTVAEVRQEVAVLRQRVDDHLKRVETWSGRLWMLITVLVGAVLSLASGLIVALTKK